MNIILDTHIFLWSLFDPTKLSKERRTLIESQRNSVFISSVSIAELMIKSSIGKITVDYDPLQAAVKSGFELLDFSCGDALLLKDLPFHHRDPFDRMLIAQSISKQYRMMTDDGKFKAYNCRLV